MLAAGDRLLRFTDRLNPMLVRCVRQELSSRVFLGTFSILLLLAVVACLVAAGAASRSGDDPDAAFGRELFAVLTWGWGFFLVVVQSGASHRLVMQERQDDTWDLVDLTGLGPRRIVRGLLLANLVQGLLSTAAIAPFLVMAYLLRGLDLITIVIALIAIPMLGIAASCLAVMAACASPAKKSRSAAAGGFVSILLLFPWFMLSMGLSEGFRSGNRIPLLLASGDPEAWLVVAGIASAWACAVGTMLAFSEALLTHPAGDRSTRPRLAWSLSWLVGMAWAIGTSIGYEDPEILAISAAAGALATLVGGFVAATEDAGLSPRQARVLDQAVGWRRTFLHLLAPGPCRGRWWLLALGVASLAAAFVSAALGGHREAVALNFAVFSLGYGGMLIASGDALARGVLARWAPTPLARRMLVITWAVLWAVVPMLIGGFAEPEGAAETACKLASPITAVILATDSVHDLQNQTVFLLLPLAGLLWLVLQAKRGDQLAHRHA